jgi:hypothetical protein
MMLAHRPTHGYYEIVAKHPKAIDLSPLIKVAYKEHARDATERFLKKLAEMLNCYGCILWQGTEGCNPKSKPPIGGLFMLGTWFPKSATFGIHNLELEDTVAGSVVLKQKPCIVNNIRKGGGKHANHPFLIRHKINKTLAAPFRYPSSE